MNVHRRRPISFVRVRLYTWYGLAPEGIKKSFGIIYTDPVARDALIRRLTKATGQEPKYVPTSDVAIETLPDTELRRGWIKNVKSSDAILALGLSAI